MELFIKETSRTVNSAVRERSYIQTATATMAVSRKINTTDMVSSLGRTATVIEAITKTV